MLVYLIKSAACLGILLLFYKLFLEKESMHRFKRYYLLIALVLAIIIPAIVFTEYVQAPQASFDTVQRVEASDVVFHSQAELDSDVLDFAPILWGIYFIGLLFFGIKFIKNLFQIFRRIRENPKHKLVRFTQVLLSEKPPPHTFFSFIFLNKAKLEANEIPKEVLLHEETHAKQKHSWDVVFVEFLQVLFWCNPFVYFTKEAVKLNHEFLADAAVLGKDIDQTRYQNTLLSYLSTDSANKYGHKFANAITNSSYTSIKKRFTVMKKNTSRKSVLLRSLFLLPIVALLIYGFSETQIVAQEPDIYLIEQESSKNQNSTDEIKKLSGLSITYTGEEVTNNDLIIHIDSKGQLLIERKVISMAEAEGLAKKLVQQEVFVRAIILPDVNAPKSAIDSLNEMLERLKVAQIDILGYEDDNDGLLQNRASEKELATFNVLAKKYNNQKAGERKISFEEVEKLSSIYQKMTESQKANALPFPNIPPPPPPMESQEEIDAIKTYKTPNGEVITVQEPATKKQVAAYNTLAKKYNTMLSKSNSIQIKMKDIERLEYLYALMSNKQKEAAEPFPDFPEPPPMPKAPETPKTKNGKQGTIPPPPPPPKTPDNDYLDEAALEEIIENQEIVVEETEHFNFRTLDPLAPIKSVSYEKSYLGGEGFIAEFDSPKFRIDDTSNIYINGKKISHFELMQLKVAGQISSINVIKKPGQEDRLEVTTIPNKIKHPPLPPEPISPLDHIIEMAKQGATFKYKRKTISADEAIRIIKSNKNLSISTKTTNNNPPIVKISKSL